MKSTKEIGEEIVEKLVALETAEDVKLFRECAVGLPFPCQILTYNVKRLML